MPPMDIDHLTQLAPVCAPHVATNTLLAIVRVESGLDPLVIGVNGAGGGPVRSATPEAAAARAAALLAAGRSIDLGLGQINARNLPRLGLTLRAAFEPCQNLAAAAQVLQWGYARAAPGPARARLTTALSYYNTGHPRRGVDNGYVARVHAAASRLTESVAAPASRPAPSDAPPAWDVFARARQQKAQALIFEEERES